MAGDWPTCRLGEIATIVMGNSPPGDAYNVEGRGVPLLNGPTEFGRVHPTPEQWTEAVTRLAEPGDVLFCVRGSTTGRQNIADQRYCIGRGLAAIRGRPEIAHTGFLRFVLLTVADDVLREARGAGSTFPSVSKDRLDDRSVRLPPLPEQRRIDAILSSVDDAIEKAEAVVAQVEVVLTALVNDLLTRGLTGRHEKFNETPAGRLPATWTVQRLDEIAEVRTGVAKNSKKLTDREVELPYLRVANVQDGYLDLAEIKTIAIAESLVDRYRLRSGDVLFNEGGDADKVGRGAVWGGQIQDCLHQNHVFAVRPSDAVLPEFLSFYGGSANGKAYFLGSAKQTTNLASINSSQLRALPVPLPPKDEQRAIVTTLLGVAARRDADLSHLAGLRSLKAGLLDGLLSGRVGAPKTEAAA